MEIDGKKAVIVGGASGMARASAELLDQRGADVAILDLPTSAGEEVATGLGGSFHPVDVMDEHDVEQALSDAVAKLGGLHIAVNTAGGGTAKRTLSKDGPHPLDEFRRVIELNLIATFNLNRLQASHMTKNEPEDGERGVMINTASIAAFEGQIGQVAYTAAKAGIAGMTLTMARDLGSLGIRVLSIAPSLFSTGITKGSPTSSRRSSRRTPPSRSGWGVPTSTAGSPSPSSRTRCSTARASASTPDSGSAEVAGQPRGSPGRRRSTPPRPGTRPPMTIMAVRTPVPRSFVLMPAKNSATAKAPRPGRSSDALDVAPHLGRELLRLRVEPLGVLRGRKAVLRHGEGGGWRAFGDERVGRHPRWKAGRNSSRNRSS